MQRSRPMSKFSLLVVVLLSFTSYLVNCDDSGTQFTILDGTFNKNNIECSSQLPTTLGFIVLMPEPAFSIADNSSGRCLYNHPVHLRDPATNFSSVRSFSTTFTFSYDGKQQGPGKWFNTTAAGFSFIIVADSDPAADTATDGKYSSLQYLGLLSPTTNNQNSSHTFGVEFDIFSSWVPPAFNDPPYDHVGVDLNSMNSSNIQRAGFYRQECSASEPGALETVFTALNFTSGSIIQAWIDYDSAEQRLTVVIGTSLGLQPPIALLNVSGIDLSGIIEETMWIGFSCAGNGDETELPAFLYAWSFNTSGPATLPYSVKNAPYVDSCAAPPKESQAERNLFLKVVLPISIVVILVVLATIAACQSRERKLHQARYQMIELDELEYGPIQYSYKTLAAATNGFREKNLLGAGGFGKVFKGELLGSKSLVAVKRMFTSSTRREHEFFNEIRVIGLLRHRNLVPLQGWCHDITRDEFLLVYEFMPNGSLDDYLFGKQTFPGAEMDSAALVPWWKRLRGSAMWYPKSEGTKFSDDDRHRGVLPWQKRLGILTGVARALLYLHEEWDPEQCVVHRDVKASNVMLDVEFNARLGDFGLARSYNQIDGAFVTTNLDVPGTEGYLAPEAIHLGEVTPKTDVYSFGILALEVVCGRRPIDAGLPSHQTLLLRWVWKMREDDRFLEVVDKELGKRFNIEEVVRVLNVGLKCCSQDSSDRPSMRQVLQILGGEENKETKGEHDNHGSV